MQQSSQDNSSHRAQDPQTTHDSPRQLHTMIRSVAEMGLMLAMVEAAKQALAAIPNVELVTFLFLVFTLLFGWRVIWVTLAFTAVETAIWGVNLWVVMYLYIWPLEVLLVMLLRRRFVHDEDGYWWYCILSALFGLAFGAFCSIPYLFLGGPRTAIAWWIAGIPYDILHGISNFVLCLVLFQPVMKAARRIGVGEHYC